MQEDLLFFIESTETPAVLLHLTPRTLEELFQNVNNAHFSVSAFANQKAAAVFLIATGKQELRLPFFIPTETLQHIVTVLQHQTELIIPISYQLKAGVLVLHNKIRRIQQDGQDGLSFVMLIYPNEQLSGWSGYYEILRYIIQATPDGIVITANQPPNYSVIFANKQSRIETGANLLEALQQEGWSFSNKSEKNEEIKQQIFRNLSIGTEGKWLMHRYQDITQSELFEWRELKVRPILDAQGNFNYWLCILTDVTERLRSEYTLRGIFKGLVGTSLDQQGNDFFNSLAKNLIKYLRVSWVTIAIKQDENTLQTLAAHKHDRLLKSYTIALKNNPAKAVLEHDSAYIDNLSEISSELSKCDKEKIFTHYLGVCLYNSQNKPIGVLEVMHHRPFDDLKATEYIMGIFSTRIASEWERLQTNKVLEEARSNLLAAMESNQDYMLILDEKQRIILANSSFIADSPQLFGKRLQSGDDVSEITNDALHKSVKIEWSDCIKRAFLGERFIKEFVFDLYEKQVYLDISFNPIFDEQGKVRSVGIFSRDVTYKRKAETTLRNNEAKLTALLENSDDVIYLLDQHFTVLIANIAAKSFYKNIFNYDLKIGQQIDTEGLSTWQQDWNKCYYDALSGERLIKEFEFESEKYKNIEVAFNPVYTKQGNIIGVSVLARNITQRKVYENELKVRNFELDSFVYRASHDLRAPLCSVKGLITLMKLETTNQELQNYLDMMAKSVTKLDDFISELISFSRNERTPIELEPIDFEQIVQEVWQELQYMDGADKVKYSISVNMQQPFFSDKMRLVCIFQNLLSNAIKYRNIRVNSFVDIKLNINELGAEIEVTDNGIGIDNVYLSRIFDMFFRASENSQGSGLGLYITKQVVNKLKGTVSVTSEPQKGTSFFIYLPHP
jgi:PAS domain S-box-containing protein